VTEINVALIGYAFTGRAHSNGYRQVGRLFSPRLTPRMKVLCGRTASAVERAARTLGWDEAATDWREVVQRPDIDLVDVGTPGDSHAEIAIAAAEAGKAVICEESLANTVAEAERMLASVRKAGGHPIGHEHTFTHTFYDLLEAMASNTPPSPGFEEGVRNQRVLEAIEQSSDRRTWVRIGEVS
jgi:predicted dehydrogenase